MNRWVPLVAGIMIIAATGCIAMEKNTGNVPSPVLTPLSPAPMPVQSTISVVTSPTAVPTILPTATITLSPAIAPEITQAQIPDAALNARIQYAKNMLDQLKDSDKADTIVEPAHPPLYCEIKISKELGYLIDATTGNTSFVKGDYGFIDSDLFKQKMTPGHAYVILHTHAKDWYTCRGRGTITLNTFSLEDLAASSNLTEQGYHVLKVIAVSDKDYEVWPKLRDDWKTKEEVDNAFDHIEQHTEVKFSIYDPYWRRTFYDVDSIMPLLARELNYSYTANHVVMA